MFILVFNIEKSLYDSNYFDDFDNNFSEKNQLKLRKLYIGHLTHV